MSIISEVTHDQNSGAGIFFHVIKKQHFLGELSMKSKFCEQLPVPSVLCRGAGMGAIAEKTLLVVLPCYYLLKSPLGLCHAGRTVIPQKCVLCNELEDCILWVYISKIGTY